jgi:hypothetical protein
MELLTMGEMADRLRIPLATARHWRATSYGPAGQRVGRRVLYLASDVDEFVARTFASSGVGAA